MDCVKHVEYFLSEYSADYQIFFPKILNYFFS